MAGFLSMMNRSAGARVASPRYRWLERKVNGDTFLGYPAHSLLVTSVWDGGVLRSLPAVVALESIDPEDGRRYPSASFPEPDADLEYRVGGFRW